VYPAGRMGDSVIDQVPSDYSAERHGSSGDHRREEWVRANFTEIFGTSPQELQARGIDPRQYAREHRDEIRQFAQRQRRQGVAVPGGPRAGGPAGGYGGYGGGRFPMRRWGGGAWIGILLALFALRFLLVDSFAGTHAAIFWVLGIGGILLVARVFLFSWLRRRRGTRGRWGGPSGRNQPG
jgi:hypothetical protein